VSQSFAPVTADQKRRVPMGKDSHKDTQLDTQADAGKSVESSRAGQDARTRPDKNSTTLPPPERSPAAGRGGDAKQAWDREKAAATDSIQKEKGALGDSVQKEKSALGD